MKNSDNDSGHNRFTRFVNILAQLRGPGGCPWDKEQTPRSMRPFLLEEVYEVIEAIDEDDSDHVREEIGDVLLILGMISGMYHEAGDFSIQDVLDEINTKLVRRHPHGFGDAAASDAAAVMRHWDRIKIEVEGRSPENQSAIDGIPGSLPPMERAWKLQSRAAKQGFDWPDESGPKAKIYEEMTEIEGADEPPDIEAEMGDLLFSVINYARHIGVNPALALRRTNTEFERRFRLVEAEMRRSGEPMNGDNLHVMDRLWNAAKIETNNPTADSESRAAGRRT